MALAAPRGSSRSLPAPARLLPAPLSGPPRPQPPPPGRSAAGRGAGSGGRSRSGPRPSQRTLGGAAPGRAWRRGALEGSVCPYPLKTAPPRPAPAGWDAQRMLGKFPCWGGSGGPRPDSGSLPQLGSWACVPHGWRLSPRQRLSTSCSPSCLPKRPASSTEVVSSYLLRSQVCIAVMLHTPNRNSNPAFRCQNIESSHPRGQLRMEQLQ